MVDLRLLAGAGGVQTVRGAAPLLASLSEDAAHVPQLLVDRQHLRLQVLQTNRIVGIITLDIVQVFVYIAEGSKTYGRSVLFWISSTCQTFGIHLDFSQNLKSPSR